MNGETLKTVKLPLFLLDFSETWLFSKDFCKNKAVSNFTKILPLHLKYDLRSVPWFIKYSKKT